MCLFGRGQLVATLVVGGGAGQCAAVYQRGVWQAFAGDGVGYCASEGGLLGVCLASDECKQQDDDVCLDLWIDWERSNNIKG